MKTKMAIVNLKRPIRRVVTSQRITRHLSAGSASGRTSCDAKCLPHAAPRRASEVNRMVNLLT